MKGQRSNRFGVIAASIALLASTMMPMAYAQDQSAAPANGGQQGAVSSPDVTLPAAPVATTEPTSMGDLKTAVTQLADSETALIAAVNSKIADLNKQLKDMITLVSTQIANMLNALTAATTPAAPEAPATAPTTPAAPVAPEAPTAAPTAPATPEATPVAPIAPSI
ncbi:MAG: hypothetical protein Q7S47_00465 [bacterium]|nr:hypothetical protein [bacterium]